MDINGSVLPVVVLDGLGFDVEVPLLCLGVLSPSSESEIGAVGFSDSLHWESGSDVEWSVNMESEVLVESFTLFLRSLVYIDDSPSLISSTVSLVNNNILHFNISVS